MGDLFLPSERQMARISPFFPLSRGVPRVDDRRVVNGIVVMRRNLPTGNALEAFLSLVLGLQSNPGSR